jgi:hypothetical protein
MSHDARWMCGLTLILIFTIVYGGLTVLGIVSQSNEMKKAIYPRTNGSRKVSPMTFRKGAFLLIGRAFALAGLIAFLITPLPAKNKPVTLSGIVTDSMCGAKHMISGDDAKCVRSCIKGGSAHYAFIVGNKIYTLKGKVEQLDKLAGEQVDVTGDLSDSVLSATSIAPTASSSAPAQAPAGTGDTPPPTTIEGLVRDVACPIQNKHASATVFNVKCAQECARLGSPLVVLTPDGTLYAPISESMLDRDQRQRLMPFLGKYLRVTGPVFERNGTRAIAIRTIEEMKNVQLKTDAE